MASQPQERLARLKRPVGSRPPTDRKLDDSCTLDGKSLSYLTPGQWLDDGTVNTFLKSLCLARPGKCVTFDSAALLPLLATLGSEETTQTAVDELYKPLRTLAATVTGNDGLVFMPFCAEGHWVLAVADFQNKVIRVYDSMVDCTEAGEVDPSNLVQTILPCVKGILSFCIDEDQWPVEHMWLPIKPNTTDCGTYVCLMALQHAYMPGFQPDDYVTRFYDWNRNWSYYELDAWYWFAGRKIILEVCRRYFKPTSTDTPRMPFFVEQDINKALWDFAGFPPAIAPFSCLMPYFYARSQTLYRVINALTWAINSIHSLGSTLHVHSSESIQNRAREVVLTPRGEPFLDEIVDEAVSYAWHDVEALQNLEEDLSRVWNQLYQEDCYTQVRLNAWAADVDSWAAYVAQVEQDAEQAPSFTDHGSPSSPGRE
ncbi:hypothetical protein INS49_010969 [Diaporthe citri]|uniref:uncharacterized protein n=1 Tax=Diaporthe citri TaxID=83186 RepID=UPI001C7FF635|nr:uncharacterized protein INS49_010969 [Diaporthe citri]KAG6359916.1 hypothetical protein INS49_010969 [Diaporthe citri]